MTWIFIVAKQRYLTGPASAPIHISRSSRSSFSAILQVDRQDAEPEAYGLKELRRLANRYDKVIPAYAL
jgi:hypothetical protein